MADYTRKMPTAISSALIQTIYIYIYVCVINNEDMFPLLLEPLGCCAPSSLICRHVEVDFLQCKKVDDSFIHLSSFIVSI